MTSNFHSLTSTLSCSQYCVEDGIELCDESHPLFGRIRKDTQGTKVQISPQVTWTNWCEGERKGMSKWNTIFVMWMPWQTVVRGRLWFFNAHLLIKFFSTVHTLDEYLLGRTASGVRTAITGTSHDTTSTSNGTRGSFATRIPAWSTAD